MPPDKVAQFIQAVVRLFDLSSEPFKHLLGPVAEKLHQNVIFIFKIEIDGTVGHTCYFCNLRNRRMEKALPGKYFNGRFKDQVIFVVFIFGIDKRPPG